jgi:hypothetical protein
MSGMGIELPQWVITTKSGKRFWELEQNNFTKEITEQCLFSSPDAANEKLKDLDVGYVVKTVRVYKDLNNTTIRLVK